MITVLCVEDEKDVRELIVEELEEAGMHVLQAENGKEGLETILEQRPDIVISDITMPEMDGIAMLGELQINYPQFSNMPFIFLTALADREKMIEGLGAGAESYLTKPIDFDVLMAKIHGLVVRIENRVAAGLEF
ncbi:Response regulator receiver domain-containing protein [Rhizobium sp. RU35A]|uniref:Response regulator n=1 Tax=Rhizobium straminoryzae TaxID=1387186 RepID=A0A549TBP5_9HYPH|nr:MULTISPECIES: response regulator [Rhizobium]TRL39313.1 response regulator [Rhizobium straminoryzae]SIP98715.1 Response regulator receiver domain-containing protein [Rhizobium sp. RU35A]